MLKILRIIAVLEIGILIGGALVCAADHEDQDRERLPIEMVPPFAAAKYGFPDTGSIMVRDDFAIGYDGLLRYARWSLEKLDRVSLTDRVDRDGESFTVDPHVPDEFRATLADYQESGYDRGHLACAADHRRSKRALRETFLLSGVAPQLPGFNRGCWKQLEEAVRRQALLPHIEAVYVLTGPLFIPVEHKLSIKTIGPHNVPVATHFFKSLLILHDDGELEAATFVLPHSEWVARGSVLDAFGKYRTTIDQLETWAGFDAWCKLDEDMEKIK